MRGRESTRSGYLGPRRYRNHLKLQKEVKFLARRQDQGARLAENAKWKKIHMDGRKANKDKWQ